MFDHRANHVGGCTPSVVQLVVSPLVALMVNQVESLRSRGVACAIMSDHEGVSQQLLVSEKHILSSVLAMPVLSK